MQKCPKRTPTRVFIERFIRVRVNTYKDVGVIAGILVSVGANTAHSPSGLATSPTVRVCGTCANVVHADRNKEIQKKQGVRYVISRLQRTMD